MADIFISYASEDRSRVESLVKALIDQGWSVFWDFTIPVGKTWRQFITEALDAANCAVVVWSSTSINSGWVHEEAEEAQERRILVPTMIDKIKLPLGFQRMQAARLMKWAGEPNHPEFEKLLEGIEVILGPSPLKVKDKEKKRAEDERRRMQEELKRKAEVEKRRTEQEEMKRKSEEEERKRREEEQRKVEEAERKKKEAEAKRKKEKERKREKEQKREAIPKTHRNSIGMEFILIPAGNFMMGSHISPEKVASKYECDADGREADWYRAEHPQHEVRISKKFYLQSAQATQAQWEKVMEDNPSGFKDFGNDCPVESVSWEEAHKFIKRLNEIEKTDKYRLPTEAEWEYACRAGTNTEFSIGDDASELSEYAWYSDNSEHGTNPVGTRKPNPWGLYDMHGNVGEWVEDDWHDNYEGAPNDGRAWIDEPRGANRVYRGGGWFGDAQRCRSALRYDNEPGSRRRDVGFRLVRSVALSP